MKVRSLAVSAPVLALILLAAAGCQRREAADAPAEAATAATAAAPFEFELENEYASVELDLPRSVAAHPDLHATLYGEGANDLRRFAEGAEGIQTEYSGEEGPMQPYSRDIEWRDGGQTGRLFSLWQTASEYTGGAHPMTTYGSVIWDTQQDRRLEPAALFDAGANMTVLDQALCQAVNAARRGRTGDASTLTLNAANDWACPRAIETAFVLEPSGEAGKAGGLVFLINPYVVGPYAEGSYSVVVPQSAFRALLAPAYAGEFAGEPARTGDVTSQT